MDTLQKASILLKHLTPGEREQILGRFESDRREQLERLIAETSEVSHAELVGIVSEYQSHLQQLSASPVEKAAPAGADDAGPNPMPSSQSISPDVDTLVERLTAEPATVLAAVLCQLPESTAGELYRSLDEVRQEAVLARLPAQGELKPIVKQELSRFLSESSGVERMPKPGSALLARLVGS